MLNYAARRRCYLTLRRPRSGRLEGWQPVALYRILRDAALRAAPQDEGFPSC